MWKWHAVFINDVYNINFTLISIEERGCLLSCCNRHGVHFVDRTVNIETCITAGCVLHKPIAHSIKRVVVSVNGCLEPVVATIEVDATSRSWTFSNVIVYLVFRIARWSFICYLTVASAWHFLQISSNYTSKTNAILSVGI